MQYTVYTCPRFYISMYGNVFAIHTYLAFMYKLCVYVSMRYVCNGQVSGYVSASLLLQFIWLYDILVIKLLQELRHELNKVCVDIVYVLLLWIFLTERFLFFFSSIHTFLPEISCI